MYNKRKFNKVNDKKVLHKVRKQWVVVSLSMLALLGTGAVTNIRTHAKTTTPNENRGINNKINIDTSSQKLVKPQTTINKITTAATNAHQTLLNNADQQASKNETVISTLNKMTSNMVNKAMQKPRQTLKNTNDANDTNVANSNTSKDTSLTNTSNKSNTYNNTQYNSPKKLNTINSKHYQEAVQHYISKLGDYPCGAFDSMLDNPAHDPSGARVSGNFAGIDPAHFILYNDGLLYLYNGNLPQRTVKTASNDQSNLQSNPTSDVNIPYKVATDSLLNYGIHAGEIRAIAFHNVAAPANSSNLFADMPALGAIDLDGLDTSSVTNMRQMFYNDVLLDQIKNIGNMNTSKATNMSYMFYYDSELKSLDLSNFDTSNVGSMNYMFANTGLRSIDLSHFNFGSIIKWGFQPHHNDLSSGLNYMFEDDKSLQDLNLSSLNNINKNLQDNPSKYTNQENSDDVAYNMFAGDNELQKITIGSSDNLVAAWLPEDPDYSPSDDIDPQTGYPSADALTPGTTKNGSWLPDYKWTNNDSTINFNSDTNIPAGTYYRVTDEDIDGMPVYFQFGNQKVDQNSSLYFSDGDQDDSSETIRIAGMPLGYDVDPRLGIDRSLAFDNSSNTRMYKVSVDQSGTWGTAHWVLTPNSDSPASSDYGYGNLYISDGTISNQFSGDKSLVHSITFGPNVHLGTNASSVFQNFPNLTYFGPGLDTTNTKNMNNLFAGDSRLSHINFGDSFSTNNVSNMSGMFNGDNDLYQIDLTPNVILNKNGQDWSSAFFTQNRNSKNGNSTSDIKNGKSLAGSFYATSNPRQISIHYILHGSSANSTTIIGAHKINPTEIASEVSQQSDLPSDYYIDPSNTYTIQHDNNGDYVNVNLDQRHITLNLVDWMTGTQFATIQDPNVQALGTPNSDASINAVLPSGYKLADHGDDSDPVSDSFSSNYVPPINYDGTNQTYSIPVVHTSDTNYGFWGTARYTLNNNGLLTVSGRQYMVPVFKAQSPHRLKLYVSDGKYQAVYSDDPRFNSKAINFVPLARYDGEYIADAPEYGIGGPLSTKEGTHFDFTKQTEVSYEEAPSPKTAAVTYLPKYGQINRFNDLKNEEKLKSDLSLRSSSVEGGSSIESGSMPADRLLANENNIKGIKFIHHVMAPSDCSAFMPYEIAGSGPIDYTFNGRNNDGEWLPNQKNLQYVDASGLDTSQVNDIIHHIITDNGNIYSDGKRISDFLSHTNFTCTVSTLRGAQTFGGMFGNMPKLKYLNLGGLFSTKSQPNIMNMFRSDTDLAVLTIGSDAKLNMNWDYGGDTPSDAPFTNSPFFNSYVNDKGQTCIGQIENGTAPAGTYYRIFQTESTVQVPVDIVDNDGQVVANINQISVQLGAPGTTLESAVQSALTHNGYQFLNDQEPDVLNNTIVGDALDGRSDTDGIIYRGYDASDNNALYVPAKLMSIVKVPIDIDDENNLNHMVTSISNLFHVNNPQQIQIPISTLQDLQNKGYVLDTNNQYTYTVRPSDVTNNNGVLSFTSVKHPVLEATKVPFNVQIQFTDDSGNKIGNIITTTVSAEVGDSVDLTHVLIPFGYKVDDGQKFNQYKVTSPAPVDVKLTLKPYQIPYQIQYNGTTISDMSDLTSSNSFTLNQPDTVKQTTIDATNLKNKWYKLTDDEPQFTMTASDANSDNQFSDSHKPTLTVEPISVKVPIKYELANGKKVGSDTGLSYTWSDTPQIPTYAQSKIPKGYQIISDKTAADSLKLSVDKDLNSSFTKSNADVDTQSLKSDLTYYVEPIQKTATIHFTNNSQTLKTITESGNDASDSEYASDTSFNTNSLSDASLPEGYHLTSTQNEALPYNNQSDDVTVSPDSMPVPVNFKDSQGTLINTGTSSDPLTVAEQGTINFSDSLIKQLHQKGYQLSTNDTYKYTIAPSDVDQNTGEFIGTKAPTFRVTPINFTIPVTYQDTNDGVSIKKPIKDQTVTAQSDLANYASNNLPAGYQLVDNQTAGLSTWKVADHINQTSSDTDPVTINMTPIQSNAYVNYVYDGISRNQNSTPVKLGSGNNSATGLKNSHFTITGTNDQGIPSGYQLSSASQTVYYDGDTKGQSISVTPIPETDTIKFIYSDGGKNLPEGSFTKTGNDSATGLSDSSFKLSSDSADVNAKLHAGFTINQPNNSIPFDGKTKTIYVSPQKATVTIDYMNGSTPVGSQKFKGNEKVTSLSDNHFTISDKPAGLWSGYHVTNPNPTIYYSDTTDDVKVTPGKFNVPFRIVASDNAGKQLDSDTSTNQITVDTTNDIKLPTNVASTLYDQGYRLPSSTQVSLSHTDLTHSDRFTGIKPVFKASAIGFKLPIILEDVDNANNVVGSTQDATNAKINQANNINGQITIPTTYRLVTDSSNPNLTAYTFKASDIQSNNTLKPLVLYVQPQSVKDTLKFMYNGQQYGNSDIISGPDVGPEGTFTVEDKVSATDLPSGFDLAGNQGTRQLRYSDKNDQIQLTPKPNTANIKYYYNNDFKASDKISGDDYATTLSDGHFIINDRNAAGLPAGWTLEDPNSGQEIKYDGGTYDVYITPKIAKDTVTFEESNGHQIGNSFTESGNDSRTGVNDTFDVTKLTAPQGYHITSTGTLPYNNQSQVVRVAPDSDIKVPFQLIDSQTGNPVGVKQQSTNTFTVNQKGTVGLGNVVPKGYKLGDNNYSFTVTPSDDTNNKFNRSAVQFKVDPIGYTLPIDYVYHNAFDGDPTIKKSTGINVDSDSDLVANYVTSNVPANYMVNTGQNFNNWKVINHMPVSGTILAPIVVNITPKQQNAVVNYKDGNTTLASNVVVGSGDTDALHLNSSKSTISNNPHMLPVGYKVVSANTPIYYNGQAEDIQVTPIEATDYITYKYNGNNVNSDASTNQLTGNEYVGTTQFKVSGLTVPKGYQRTVNNAKYESYDNQNVIVNVTPVQATDVITYKYGKKIITDNNSTKSVSGNEYIDSSLNYHASPLSFTFNHRAITLPSDYTWDNDQSTTHYYDGNPITIKVTPIIKIDHIQYKYTGTGQTGQYVTNDGGTPSEKGADINSFNTNTLTLPTGYTWANSNQKNQNVMYNNKPVEIDVKPGQLMDHLDYMYNTTPVSTSDVSGNDYRAKLADNTSFKVGENPKGLPNGYQVIDSDQEFNYDGQNHIIQIKPKRIKSYIDYDYEGYSHNPIATTSVSGDDYATGLPDSYFTIGSNPAGFPNAGWTLNDPGQEIKYDGGTYHVDISPKQATDTITFKESNGHQIGNSFTESGNDSRTVNGSFKIDTLTNVPHGYHLKSTTGSIPYDNQAHTVTVAPDAGIKILFQLVDSKTGDTVGTNQKSTNSFTVNQPGNISLASNIVPKGYQLSQSNNSSFTVTPSDEQNGQFIKPAINFKIDPITYKLPIYYVYQNSFDGNPTYNKSTSTNVDADFNLASYITNNVPANYIINAGQHFDNWKLLNQIPSTGTTLPKVTVKVTPKQSSALVNYKYGLTTVASNVNVGSGDTYALGLNSSSFKIGINPGTKPNGYKIVNPNTIIKYNGQAQDVQVTPIQAIDPIVYKYNKNTVNDSSSTPSVTGNEYIDSSLQYQSNSVSFKLGDKSITLPNGYTWSNNVEKIATQHYNNQLITVNVVPIQATDKIVYKYNDNPVTDASSTKSISGNEYINEDRKYSASPLSFTFDNVAITLPSKYTWDSDQSATHYYNNQIIVVNVKPKTKVDTIQYEYGHTTVTNDGGTSNESGYDIESFNTKSLTLPTGYTWADSSQKNQAHEFDGNVVKISVKPLLQTDHLIYVNGSTQVGQSGALTGNDYHATAAGHNSFKVGSTPNGLPNGYMVVTPGQQFKYDGNDHIVQIAPKSYNIPFKVVASDDHSHVLNVGSYGKSTNQITVDTTGTLTLNITGINNALRGQSYQFTNGQDMRFNLKHEYITDSNQVNANNEPVFTATAIAYKLPVNYLDVDNDNQLISGSSHTFTSLSAFHSNDVSGRIPSGYALVSGHGNPNLTQYNINAYNANADNELPILNVYVQPNTTQDIITFMYKGHPYDNAVTVSVSGPDAGPESAFKEADALSSKLPNGFTFADNNGNDMLHYYDHTDKVNITPVQTPAHIKYYYAGDPTPIATADPTGDDYATGLTDGSFNIGNYAVNLPVWWTLNDPTQVIKYNNGEYDVDVSPLQVIDPITFKAADGTKIGTTSKVGNDYRTGVNGSFNTDAVKAPKGYHVAVSQSLNYDGRTHTVTVAPDAGIRVPFQLVDNQSGHVVASGESSNVFTVNQAGMVTVGNGVVPKGYQLGSNNYSFKVTPDNEQGVKAGNPVVSYKVDPINYTLPITYEYSNLIDSNPTTTKNVSVNMDSGFKLNNYADQNVPTNYMVNAGQNLSNWNLTDYIPALGTTLTPVIVKVTPTQQSAFVNYKDGVNTVAANVNVGSGDTNALGLNSSNFAIGTNPVGKPAGYKIVDPNASISYDGQTTDVQITPIIDKDIITYEYDGQIVTDDGGTTNEQGPDISSFNTNNLSLPTGYTWANSDQKNRNIMYNNHPVEIDVKPILQTDHLIYMNDSQQVGQSGALTGNDYHATAAGHNSFKVGSTPDGLPNGYSVVTPDQHFGYDGQNHQVNVAPDTEHVNVEFINQNGANVGTATVAKPFTAQETMNQLGTDAVGQLPAGYIIKPNQDTTYTFGLTQPTEQVRVVGRNVTIPVEFINHTNGTQLGATENVPAKIGDTITLPVIPEADSLYVYYGSNPTNYTVTADKFDHSTWQINNPVKINLVHTTGIIVPIKFTNHGQPVGSIINGLQGYENHDVNVLNFAEDHLPNGYQLANGQDSLDSYRISSNNVTEGRNSVINVAIEPIQKTDNIRYYDGSQLIPGGTPSETGNAVVNPNSFATSSLTLPQGYKLASNSLSYVYNGQIVDVQVVPKMMSTTINFSYGDQSFTSEIIRGLSNATFDTNSLILPNGYQLANGNQVRSYDDADVVVDLTPKQAIDTINYIDNHGHVINTVNVTGNSSETGLNNSHFTVGNDPTGLPSGYQVDNPSQIINYDDNTHSIGVEHIVQPVSVPGSQPSPSPSIPSASSIPTVPTSPSNGLTPVVPVNNNVPSHTHGTSDGAKKPSVPMISKRHTKARTVEPVKHTTNKGLVVKHGVVNKRHHDVVIYHGHKHIVHYHSNGKSTVRIKVLAEKHGRPLMKHGKPVYHYKNVVVRISSPADNVPKGMIKSIDSIDFAQPAKRIRSVKKLNRILNNIISVGKIVSYYGTKYTRIKIPAHFRYFITSRKLLAHLLINEVGNAKDKHARRLNKKVVFHIRQIIVVHKKYHNYVRYEFRFHHHNYWVTANKNYVQNAYVQTNDFKRHHTHEIRVTRNCCMYSSSKYSKYTRTHSIKKGAILRVKKVIFLGNMRNDQTRLLLTNDEYITANKQFIKLYK